MVGEPGIGKSRLLAELSSRAEEQDLLVLAGEPPSSSGRSHSGARGLTPRMGCLDEADPAIGAALNPVNVL